MDEMNPMASESPDILMDMANRLHAEISASEAPLMESAGKSLIAAWHAGEALAKAKSLVGHGRWELYVKNTFTASLSTAKRYMAVRKSLTSVSDLRGKTLKQVYRELEKISDDTGTAPVKRLSPPGRHIHYSQQLRVHIQSVTKKGDAVVIKRLQEDLSPLNIAMNDLFAKPVAHM